MCVFLLESRTYTHPHAVQMIAPSSAVSSTASACRLLTSDWTGFAALQKREGHKDRTARIDRRYDVMLTKVPRFPPVRIICNGKLTLGPVALRMNCDRSRDHERVSHEQLPFLTLQDGGSAENNSGQCH